MGMNDMKGLMPLLIRSAIDQEVQRQAETLKLIKKGDKGDKGEKGDKGKDGYTPQKGLDYFDGLPGKDGYTPIKGVDYFDGLPGKDADLSPATLAASVKFVLENTPELLNSLKGAPGKDGVSFELAEDVLTFGGEWKAGVTYRKGALVALGGDIWYRDTPGSDGKPGRGLQWKMFLRSGAGRLSGYGVVQGQGGGGITSLTIDSTPITGGTAGAVLFVDATGTKLTDDANLTYTTASGPRLQVGTTGTSAGWLLGYGGSSGLSSIWNSTIVSPDGTNSALAANSTSTFIGAASTIRVYANGSQKAEWLATAGSGQAITAGTATTDVQALSATQTWNASGVTFTGIKYTITDTASAAGSLAMQILGGASGTTELMRLEKGGVLGLPAGTAASPSLLIGTNSGMGFYTGSITGIGVAYSGTGVVRWITGTSSGGAASHASGAVIGWESGPIGAGNPDTAFNRLSAGLAGLGTGANNSFAGRLKLTSVIASGVAFASLNASPTAGEIQYVTDSNTATWGATVAGGGANKVLVWYNGTNWTVVGA